MASVFIFYDSKYGNTKLAAEKIAEGLKSAGVAVEAGYVREVGLDGAACSDLIVLGAPNHMGRPSRTMKRFIEYLATADLKATKVAVFGTYAGRARPIDRAVKKLEGMVQERLPNLGLVLPGLSVRVNGIKGPVVDGELDRCVEFGRSIAVQLGV
ncbi:MAG: flavodoxin domain-containing protein [Candidatus Bathyarchaeota archaeon]|nr:flavodoxin domain-containing protein [Candidatus Bathyarchaeota archaeon]